MASDPIKAKARKQRYRARLHAERYGPDAGDMRGRTGTQPAGPDHPRWNDGRMLSDEGYVLLRVGRDHPLADPNGYAYEHLVVWVSAGNPKPPRGFTLHHKDEVKANNRLSNLELLRRADHGRHHIAERERDPETGRLRPKAPAVEARP